MLDKPEQQLTDEQLDILNAAHVTKSNLMIEALAGTGKTSTLEAVVDHLPHQPVLYLCFNKKNATEAEGRMPSTVTTRTFNSIGHRAWAASTGRNLSLDFKKSQTIFKAIAEEMPKGARDTAWECYWQVLAGVNLAKALGYLPPDTYPGIKPLIGQGAFHAMLEEEPDDLTADLIDAVLVRSIKSAYAGVVDFNDQVYMPALFSGTFPEFPQVLVDEYQDLSPTNHALLHRLAGKRRLIGVGDPCQNIYGFRGASAGGMGEAVARYGMVTFPLSTSFRCPSEIVRHVHWHVPHFRAHKEGGNVCIPASLAHTDIGDSSTIISRNNAPLLRMAFGLLSSERSVAIVGSDVGPKLIGILRKLGPGSSTRTQTLGLIADWEAEKLAKESTTAADLAACMRVFAEHGSDLDQAISYAEHLFRQTGSILLTTIHKAKGLEWPDVIHLDPWLVRKHPTDQNKNLDYVCSTRSSCSLTEIDSDRIQW